MYRTQPGAAVHASLAPGGARPPRRSTDQGARLQAHPGDQPTRSSGPRGQARPPGTSCSRLCSLRAGKTTPRLPGPRAAPRPAPDESPLHRAAAAALSFPPSPPRSEARPAAPGPTCPPAPAPTLTMADGTGQTFPTATTPAKPCHDSSTHAHPSRGHGTPPPNGSREEAVGGRTRQRASFPPLPRKRT